MPFSLLQTQPLPDFQARILSYRHPCGMRHYHLEAPAAAEQSFLVAFPTAALADDGRAHILEHLALEGSERYPAGHPFQAMTQRSLASFMNAMTYFDRTVYPFATPDPQDFRHLLDVYLDAAFFPLLRREDFQQEGWRHVLRAPEGPLRVEGVVYNEMKGAGADRLGASFQRAMAALFPGTPYAFEYGGDPARIPTLSHEELVAFHRRHYHPSQAVVVTHGAFDPAEVQAALEDVIARRTDPVPTTTALPLRSSLQAPVDVTVTVPPGDADDDEQAFAWGWALGPAYVDDEALVAVFMGQALVGGDASVLGQRLSQQGFGRPGALSGADANAVEAAFWVGMDGLAEGEAPRAQAIIAEALAEVAARGIPLERLEAVFQDMSLAARDVGGRLPEGVTVALEMVPAALAGGDVAGAVDPARLDAWKDRLTDPAFVAAWVQAKLLDNPRQVRVTLVPDPDWMAARERDEEARLAATLRSWSDRERVDAVAATAAFDARAHATASTDGFPILDLARVSPEPLAHLPVVHAPGTATHADRFWVDTPSRGIAQLALHVDLGAVADEDWPWVRTAVSLLDSVGLDGLGWEEAAEWRAARAPSLGVGVAALPMQMGLERWVRTVALQCKTLERQPGQPADALARTLMGARFDDPDRVAFLLQERRDQMRAQMASAGNRLAALEAVAGVHALARAQWLDGGRPALAFLDHVLTELSHDPAGVLQRLTAAHAWLVRQPRLAVAMGSAAIGPMLDDLAAQAAGAPAWPAMGQGQALPWDACPPVARAVVGNTPVQFCHQIWPGPAQSHPDAPVLEVLAEGLSSGFLHSAIREQGSAYGARAHVEHGAFSMYSYRDPRLADTFADFDRAAAWAQDHAWTDEELHRAKLGVLRRMAAPPSPLKRAKATATAAMSGVSTAQRKAYRAGVLGATGEDLRRVAGAWLGAGRAHRAVFTHPDRAGEAAGFEVVPAWPAPVSAPGPRLR